jgi:hypothetical protein
LSREDTNGTGGISPHILNLSSTSYFNYRNARIKINSEEKLYRTQYFGIWHHVDLVRTVLKKYVASIFRVEGTSELRALAIIRRLDKVVRSS